MSSTSRVTTYSNGQIIDAGILNQELDVLHNGHNDAETRLVALESGNMVITGNKTLQNNISVGGTLSVTGATSITNALTLSTTSSYFGLKTAGQFAFDGDIFTQLRNLRAATTDATVTKMDTNGAGGTLAIPANSTWGFRCTVVGQQNASAGGSAATYIVHGSIKNIGGTTALVGTAVKDTMEDVAGWDVTVTANNTLDTLEVNVTGAAATTIRWSATIEITQVTHA